MRRKKRLKPDKRRGKQGKMTKLLLPCVGWGGETETLYLGKHLLDRPKDSRDIDGCFDSMYGIAVSVVFRSKRGLQGVASVFVTYY